ncbi:hypothetical protein VDT04_003507 [Vibrio cholerae]|nr:hypothetical protein [Vibrio cholerae]EMC4027183.1 hypothetical protein [Vibrio cholerae]
MEEYLEKVSIFISLLALCVSGLTAWFTFFHRGKLKATQPTVIFFGPDGLDFSSQDNKVYLRTLLFSTSKRGHVIESMHLSVVRNESKQNFNIWVYGNKGELTRGSGLFVPQCGVTYDHHFLLPSDGADFKFLAGDYELKLYARLVGAKESTELKSIKLNVSDAIANQIVSPNTGAYFDWGADKKSYHAHTKTKRPIDPEKLFEQMANKRLKGTANAWRFQSQ